MKKEQQRRRAEEFLAAHAAPEIVVLANAWDVVSARLYELEGFKAIGTTSAGIAATMGYPDGECMSLDDNAAAVRRIAAAVNVPVSADAEAGYATSPDGVATAVRTMLEAGAVGVNLEDCTGDPERPLYDVSEQVEKIKAAREVAKSYDVPMVLNARTDVYLVPENKPKACLGETVARANAYRQAGADCIFVPDWVGLGTATIRQLVAQLDAPLNVIAGEQSPPIGELEELGVARISFGPKAMRAALALVRNIAREWKETGTYTRLLQDSLSYTEVNKMLRQDDCCKRTRPA